jgi:hypothetical protein
MMVLAVLLGAGAGLAVLEFGGSPEWSMTATFFAAIGPLMWHVRHNRTRGKDVD